MNNVAPRSFMNIILRSWMIVVESNADRCRQTRKMSHFWIPSNLPCFISSGGVAVDHSSLQFIHQEHLTVWKDSLASDAACLEKASDARAAWTDFYRSALQNNPDDIAAKSSVLSHRQLPGSSHKGYGCERPRLDLFWRQRSRASNTDMLFLHLIPPSFLIILHLIIC